MDSTVATLLDLSHALGDPALQLAILAEGNASAKSDRDTFWIKASGFNMATLQGDELIEVQTAPILQAFAEDLDDAGVKSVLAAARCDATGDKMPSVESFMHAWLLSLPDVMWVAHTHPTALLALLTVAGAKERAPLRLFPDEVVCCGPKSCFVPYTDPGLPLARAIRDAVTRFIDQEDQAPKTIWLQNHGLIVLGRSPKEALSGSLMSEKSAKVWLGALSSGCEPRFLTEREVDRIHTRPDEHYRQRLLWHVSPPGL